MVALDRFQRRPSSFPHRCHFHQFLLKGCFLPQDNEQVTALHWAVLCRSHEHSLRLLKAGAALDAVDAKGRTVLHYAVCNDAAPTLRVLLEHRDVKKVINAKDVRGQFRVMASVHFIPCSCCRL